MQHDEVAESVASKQLTLTEQSLETVKQCLIDHGKNEGTAFNDQQQQQSSIDISQKQSNVWMSFKKLHLSQEDRRIIAKGQWLNDKHMAMAMRLIKTQFPELNGFMATVYQSSRPLSNTNNALQVIHTDRSTHAL